MAAIRGGSNGATMGDKPRCKLKEERNGIVYQCAKTEGHELIRGDEEHEVCASEYVDINWRQVFEATRPLLEWIAANQHIVGQERNELARRILIRAYLATSPHPDLAKKRK